jgi:predicted transcriptional regulator YdeE
MSTQVNQKIVNQQTQMRAGLVEVDPVHIVGVSCVTTNRDGHAAQDINALWARLFEAQIGQKIKNKTDDTIYCVYSDYEGDHDAPYRVTIGYRVNDVKTLPDRLFSVSVAAGHYAMMSAQGPQPHALIETWEAIWSSDLNRRFKTDFEIYGPRFFEDGVHEVLVHVGVNIDD